MSSRKTRNMSEKEVKKICSCVSLSTVKWKLANRQGKIILDFICGKVYSEDKDDQENSKTIDERFDEELHAKCQTLANILDTMSEAVAELEGIEDKAVGLEQLCDISASMNKSSNQSFNSSSSNNQNSSNYMNSSNYPNSSMNYMNSSNYQNSSMIELDKSVLLLSSDLTKWTQSILNCYKNQLKMNQIVTKNICHLKSREEALFHLSIWVVQPALDPQCLVAECAVEQTIKSCSE
eukprot:GFUD01097287.1.p1 GENE.GFUD01097287.1~~GFUD01097287.1.p1  ORF type:complete len:236 (+),score=60.50 GFUD01097287.1:127-834(+)